METKEDKPLPSTLYTEEYFLTACEGYDVFVESEGRHLSRRLNDAFAMAEVGADMRILDVGCGRGEIIRHCMKLGIEAYGVDYAEVATLMTRDVVNQTMAESEEKQQMSVSRVYRSDAKRLPFPDNSFDRVLMFDVVEHLYPWELHEAMLEVRRVLKDDGRFIIHTAPNRWYDKYAYPVVRFFRRLFGQGGQYPKNPRAIVPVNQDVHVNEQDIRSMNQALRAAGFEGKVWLDTPPQNRRENFILAGFRRLFFDVPPFRWFFEREVFAVAVKKI
jgi:ubiquinone/menaquinone biosynthesis C-methylase UbiE